MKGWYDDIFINISRQAKLVAVVHDRKTVIPEWGVWFSDRIIHEQISDITPVESEQGLYAAQEFVTR